MFVGAERNNILNGVRVRNLFARLGMCVEDERRARGLEGYYGGPEYNRQRTGRTKTILDGNAQEITITYYPNLHSLG